MNILLRVRSLATIAILFLVVLGAIPSVGQAKSDSEEASQRFLQLLIGDTDKREQAFDSISENWRPDYSMMLLEVLYLSRDPAFIAQLIALLQSKTKQTYGYDIDRWYEWLWSQEPQTHPDYADFKGLIYGLIDPRFREYFSSNRPTTIRLDEVRWGGVLQDGIPPLRYPKMTSVAEADYLADDNIVFALEVNGDARAYPKRILGWHEMFVDDVGGVPVAGVYCTLCGTMILYKTVHNGINHKLGTSGFLYRSNKLMYDKDTQSLWNTFWGRPVVGPLVLQDIKLEHLSVVTTTWGEWRRRHPDTKVLSLDTGYRRDYSEGAAYRDYFATDELMFTVPERDQRLRNKDEVLGLVFPQYPDKPLAISASYLVQHTVYHDRVEDLQFVVLTDQSGANRVYETAGLRFRHWDLQRIAVDEKGRHWTLSESRLQSTDGGTLHRLPAYRAFWFGWYSAYSHTRLVR